MYKLRAGILSHANASVVVEPATDFKFEVVVQYGDLDFTLPLITNEGHLQDVIYNFNVDWGDGSSTANITSGADVNKNHTYASPGTYNITMSGLCEQFTFDNELAISNRDAYKFTKILELGDLGFRYLNFPTCVNLTSVATDKPVVLTSLELVGSLFAGCSKLTTVPEDLFKGSPRLGDFFCVFAGCTALTSIPADIFKYSGQVTDYYNRFDGAFSGCTSLTSIPTGLFRYAILTTDFSTVFSGCTSLASIPAELFAHNTEVTTFYRAFYGCSALTSIPTDLFRFNTIVNSMDGCFYGCTNLASISTDLFIYNTDVTTFSSTFNTCSKLTSIPAELFRYNINCTNFSNTFSLCPKLQLNADIFYVDGEQSTRFAGQTMNFTGCFKIATGTFTGTQGTAPDLWNCSVASVQLGPSANHPFRFHSATSLTNYASIPTAWK